MANPTIPINVMINQKKSHYSNDYLDERKKNEEKLKPPPSKITTPSWLNKEAKKIFKKSVTELKTIDLVTSLDINSLAIYSDNMAKYIQFEDEIDRLKKSLDGVENIDDAYDRMKMTLDINKTIINFTTKKLQLGDAIRKYAVEFGLTPQSRAKLAIPREKEEKKTKSEEMFINV